MIYKALWNFVDLITRGITPKYTNKGECVVLNQKCIRNGRINISEARKHDNKTKPVAENKVLKKYDILVNSTGVGTLGRVAQNYNDDSQTTVDSHITIVRPGKDVNPVFLGYVLRWRQAEIEALAEGSTGQTELSRQRLGNEITVPVFSLAKQKKIAKVLSALDDKIEQNNAINHNLQQLIRSIFDKWFICSYKTTSKDIIQTTLGSFPSDFKMQRLGELPIQVTDYVANGSFASLKENVKLFQERNYAYFIRNTDLKSGSFEVFVDKHSYDFLIKSRLFGGEIIISNVGDVGSVFLCPVLDAPMTLGNNIIMLKPQDDFLRFYLFIWFKYSIGQGLIQGIKSGSAQPKFNKTDFKNLPIILPPKELLMRFHSLVLPMFESIEKNNSENRKLNCLRNTLLPKLMSGELDVSEVEI